MFELVSRVEIHVLFCSSLVLSICIQNEDVLTHSTLTIICLYLRYFGWTRRHVFFSARRFQAKPSRCPERPWDWDVDRFLCCYLDIRTPRARDLKIRQLSEIRWKFRKLRKMNDLHPLWNKHLRMIEHPSPMRWGNVQELCVVILDQKWFL